MPRASLCLLVTLSLAALTGCAPQLSPVVTVLEPVEHTLSGAAAQRHQIDLPADSYFRIEVEQLGIDAVVEVLDHRGKSITTVNTPTARVGSESALVKTSEAGSYQVLLRSNEHAKKEGRYRLSIEQLNTKTRDDKRRIKAQQAMTEAARLNVEIADSSGSEVIKKLREAAVQQYQVALSYWRKLGDTEAEAWVQYYTASHYNKLAEWDRAASTARAAASRFEQLGAKPAFASTLQLQAEALTETRKQDDFKRATALFSEALAIHQASGNLYGQAETILTLGVAFYQQGELAKAREQFVTASAMFSTLDEIQQAMWTANNIAVTDEELGNYPAAVATFQKALKLLAAGGYALERAFLLNNLANAYAFLGQLQEALLNYSEAATLFDSVGDRLGTARAFSGTALTYTRLGEWQLALSFYKQALELQGSAENSELVEIYRHMGSTQRYLQQPLDAIATHKKALEKARLSAEKAMAHTELGRDYAAIGDYSAAEDHFSQALELATPENAPIAHAFALQERGHLKVAHDINIKTGLIDLKEALRQHRALHSEAGEAQTLQSIAQAEHKLGRVDKAIEYAAQALAITEALRIRVGNPNLRLSFTGLQLPTYELHIKLLMELAASKNQSATQAANYSELALEVSERARARSLVELLTEAKAEEQQGIDPQLRKNRSAKRQQLANLASLLETQAAHGSDPNKITNIQNELRSVQADLDIINAKIRKQNGNYAELTRPQLLKARQIQRLLEPVAAEDKETVLLQYSLGDEHSFLWYVTATSIDSWRLPGRSEIEAVARQVYASLKIVDLDPSARKQAHREGVKLVEMVLAPVLDRLHDQRLVIVADGALQYIPFAALPVANANGATAALLEQHEVINLPSASTLAMLRKARQNRETAEKAIAIFADPVLNLQDSRLPDSSQVEQIAATRSAEAPDSSLFRLPASGQEADAIARLVPADSVLKATGFDASRSNVINGSLGDYHYVHFATHGLINAEYPGLSSLALSAFDKDGKAQPSFLRLYDIYGLHLNADLVVLSACEAALGKDIRGEGLVGLTRGFMYAGAPAVVASLWRASDAATAALMQEFYRLMLKHNTRPAAALRKAQLAISAQRKWRDPYYWAGFVLQGDWR